MIIRTDSLVVGYNFDNETTLTDQSENEYDGTVTACDYVATLYGDSFFFNGASSKVAASNGPLASYDQTIAFWMRCDNMGADHLISNGSVTSTNRQNVYTSPSEIVLYTYGSDIGAVTISGSAPQGIWHHIVVTREFDGANTTAKLYIDGINVDTDVSAAVPGLTDTDMVIGSRGTSLWYEGYMVDLEIHNVAKDSTWVATQRALKIEEVNKNVGRLLSQFSDSTKLQALIQVFSARIDEQNQIIENLRDTVTLDNAYSTWLDMIGQIVGIPRPFKQQPYATCFAYKGAEADPDDLYKGFYSPCLP